MIYDCFTFFNELDVLDIRLNVLNDVVDKFVLVEAAFTHTGHPKNFIFDENKDRFSKFLDKIIHIKLQDNPTPPPGGSATEQKWFLENFQRNAIAEGLADAKPSDIIMVSDCDEIPDPLIVKRLPRMSGITHFNPRAYNFYLNLRNHTSPFFGNGTTALSYADFQNPKTYRVFPYQPFVPKIYNPGPSATKVRFLDPSRRFKSGWHFSFLGGAEAISKKIHSTADGNDYGLADMPLSKIEDQMRQGVDLFNRGDHFFAEPLERDFPEYVRRHSSALARLILHTSQKEFASSRPRRYWELIRGLIARFPQDRLYPTLGPIRRKLKRLFVHEELP